MTNQMLFPKLFESCSIGKLKLRNRIVMLPMGTAFATLSGEVTQRTIDYYVERAKGGVSLVTVGNISPYLPNAFNQLVLDSDWVLMGHYELVENIHRYGAMAVAQLNHPGRQKYPGAMLRGEEIVSSSAIATTHMGEVYPIPKAMSKSEIYRFIGKFVSAAERAKRVGYDMIELHGAHGYLINQFMSPFMNNRTDDFGGSLENRMRFPLELIGALQQTLGPDFPIGIRISAVEFVPGGITLDESVTIAKILETAGVAYISVSAGVFESCAKTLDTMRDREGWKEYMWEAIKRVVKVPVLAGGNLRHLDFCERIIAQEKADMIGLARPLLADPEWPRKAKEGRVGDIRLCISCNECIFGSTRRRQGGGARRCTVNATFGREREFAVVTPTRMSKNVMVIGGGPGGMEVARVAALRGHKVTLYERGQALGGQMLIAGKPEGKTKILWLRDYLATQLKKCDVKVQLGTEVTSSLVKEAGPDCVVVATGAEPILPDIPGIKGSKVANAFELLNERVKIERETVTVIGGGMVGCEVAEYLLESGNRVTIIEQLLSLAADMEPIHRFEMLRRFEDDNVVMLSQRRAFGITKKGVQVVNLENGQEELVESDWIIIAVGTRPVNALVSALEDKVPELCFLGDCKGPRNIMEAIYEASLIGRQI